MVSGAHPPVLSSLLASFSLSTVSSIVRLGTPSSSALTCTRVQNDHASMTQGFD